MNLVNEIIDQAKKFFLGAKGSHDFDHTMRVLNLCRHIGKTEKANMEILEIAAVLHDIGRKHQDKCNGKICHAKIGAELAMKLLLKLNFDRKKIDQIIHCISTHRFRGEEIPISKEAKILFDADKLDSIGAVGIGRTFLFAGEVGARLHNKDVDIWKTKAYSKEDTAYREYMFVLKEIKNRMLTKEGKRIAEERHNFMVEFFDRLDREVDGDL
ncbi:MAG: HD domain-containing protein [Patescibacteria group bacterium]|nr:HD domain-containing protein [Patescibacteria group bacterium]